MPYDECFAIMGAPGTGKSTALARRITRAQEANPDADPLVIGLVSTIDEYAAALLRSRGAEVTLVDDVEAELTFAQACAPLFALQWEEFSRRTNSIPKSPDCDLPSGFSNRRFV